MKRIAILIFATLLAASACSGQDKDSKIGKGDTVPSFTVTMTNGEQVSIDQLRGKVVLINFFATWCPPCRKELTRVEKELIEQFAGQQFLYLPISRGEERDTVVGFLKQNGYRFAAGLDTDQSIYGLFATNYIPRNYLIDAQGVVVETEVGYTPSSFDALVKEIDKLLKTK